MLAQGKAPRQRRTAPPWDSDTYEPPSPVRDDTRTRGDRVGDWLLSHFERSMLSIPPVGLGYVGHVAGAIKFNVEGDPIWGHPEDSEVQPQFRGTVH